LVTLVAQDRTVATYSAERTPTDDTVQSDPGNFTFFDQTRTYESKLFPGSVFTSSQSSSLSVTAMGAQFIAQGNASTNNSAAGTGGLSSFSVTFDVPSAVAYEVVFGQGHDLKHPQATANLSGPSGFPIIGFENQTNTFTGTLSPGKYVLSTSAFGGQEFTLKMYVGSAIPAA